MRWVRPLHSILCLFDGEPVRFEIQGIAAGAITYGHRFMAPRPLGAPLSGVRDFADYAARLREAKVMLDGAERRAVIARAAEEIAAAHGYVVEDDPALLDEVKGLVEWPVPLGGAIDEAFMTVPPEVLVSTMRFSVWPGAGPPPPPIICSTTGNTPKPIITATVSPAIQAFWFLRKRLKGFDIGAFPCCSWLSPRVRRLDTFAADV